MIDENGYRLNVGIIVANEFGKLLWAQRRFGGNGWQFPQGGIKDGESTLDAMYRELDEELGLKPESVSVIAESQSWYSYKLPEQYLRKELPVCIGQRQRWFLLKLNAADDSICLSANANPEFKDWRWVSYWEPVAGVIAFKRQVYRDVLTDFESYMNEG